MKSWFGDKIDSWRGHEQQGDSGGHTEDRAHSDETGQHDQGGVANLFKKIVKIGRDAGGTIKENLTNGKTPLEEEEDIQGGTDPQVLKEEMDTLLEKLEAYAKLEVEGSLSELECLQKLNRMSVAKYEELSSTVEGLDDFQAELFRKYDELRPAFAEIDQLHDVVCELEVATQYLDTYTKRLEINAQRAADEYSVR